jgi:hypothetical protein
MASNFIAENRLTRKASTVKHSGAVHKKWPRAFLSLAALAFLYANVSVIISYPLQELHSRPPPVEPAFRDAFLIFGVFSYYETSNTELTIWGYATNPLSGMRYWKELPTNDYFPFDRGNQQSRLWANRQYNEPERRGHWGAWQFMGRRILERYNREHPNDGITKVGIRSLTWPRSPKGFYAEEAANSSGPLFWVVCEMPAK